MTQILAISKSGKDVTGTTNTTDDLIFSSNYNTLKYYTSGTVSLQNINNGTTTVVVEGTVAHNLGYAPFFITYVNAADATSGGGGTTIGTNTYNIVAYSASFLTRTKFASSWIDSSNLYFQLRNRNGGTLNATFYYKIFKNNLGL